MQSGYLPAQEGDSYNPRWLGTPRKGPDKFNTVNSWIWLQRAWSASSTSGFIGRGAGTRGTVGAVVGAGRLWEAAAFPLDLDEQGAIWNSYGRWGTGALSSFLSRFYRLYEQWDNAERATKKQTMRSNQTMGYNTKSIEWVVIPN